MTFLIIASPADLERYLAGLVKIVRAEIVNFGRTHDTFYLETFDHKIRIVSQERGRLSSDHASDD